MSATHYLPSRQFSMVALSIVLSAGLVYGAKAYTEPHPTSFSTDASKETGLAAAHADWAATLASVQADAGITAPQAPDIAVVDGMRQAAKSDNMTETAARTLLVNLTNAKAQGLGNDIPTQNGLIANAAAAFKQDPRSTQYIQKNLVVVADSKDAVYAYANALATVLAQNKGDEYKQTLIAIDNATSLKNADYLKPLAGLSKQYASLTKAFLAVPVPQTLVPFHLQLVNNFQTITNTYPAMKDILVDPLKGLSALQTFKSTTDESYRVFINIAQAITKGGILFRKDEPGAAWAVLLSLQH